MFETYWKKKNEKHTRDPKYHRLGCERNFKTERSSVMVLRLVFMWLCVSSMWCYVGYLFGVSRTPTFEDEISFWVKPDSVILLCEPEDQGSPDVMNAVQDCIRDRVWCKR